MATLRETLLLHLVLGLEHLVLRREGAALVGDASQLRSDGVHLLEPSFPALPRHRLHLPHMFTLSHFSHL